MESLDQSESNAAMVAHRMQQALDSAVLEAVNRLRDAARGTHRFAFDDERWACVALARMARKIIADAPPPPKSEVELYHPDNTPEDVEQNLIVLGCEPEEAARRAREFAALHGY